MTAGNEKTIKRVILDGKLMEWVGIGWITLREVTARDLLTYRTVQE
jgi:hypothetical protein